MADMVAGPAGHARVRARGPGRAAPAAGRGRLRTVEGVELHVFAGDDDLAVTDRVRALLATSHAGGVEHVDVAADGGAALAAAVASPPLFGARRVVAADNIDALADLWLDALAAAAPGSDALVVARAGTALPARLRARLGRLGTVETLSRPKGNRAAAAASAITAAGLRLGPAERRLLAARCGADPARLRSVLAQLRLAGIERPTAAQLDTLCGTAAAPPAPWQVSDALEAGDVAAALDTAAGLEPVAVVAHLAARTAQAGRIVDGRLAGPDDIAATLGVARFAAERLARLAGRLGPAGVAASWDAVVAADRAVKGHRHPRAALDVCLLRLAPRWAARGA